MIYTPSALGGGGGGAIGGEAPPPSTSPFYNLINTILGLGKTISPSNPILGWVFVIIAIISIIYLIGHIKKVEVTMIVPLIGIMAVVLFLYVSNNPSFFGYAPPEITSANGLFLFISSFGKTVYKDSTIIGWGIIALIASLFLLIRREIKGLRRQKNG